MLTKKLQPSDETCIDQQPACECDRTPPLGFDTDLYFIGRSWLDGVSMALVGAKLPTVSGAPKEEPKDKSGKKKLQDLSIYDLPPERPPDPYTRCEDRKILREILTPYVSACRKATSESLHTVKQAGQDTFNELKEDVIVGKNRAVIWLRSDKNVNERRAIVAGSGILAYFLPLKPPKGLLKKIFHVTGGLLASGALCFPSETDEYFRTACGYVHRAVTAVVDLVRD